MLISLTRLFSSEGRTQEETVPLEADRFRVSGDDCAVLARSPVSLSLAYEENRVFTVKGDVRLTVAIPCARCLTPVPTEFDLRFDRKIDLALSEEERENLEEDSSFLIRDDLDVEELVRNELLVHWPIRVLCKDDCKGICSRCGANLNVQTCDCDTAEPDPRMAAIRDIFSKFKEV